MVSENVSQQSGRNSNEEKEREREGEREREREGKQRRQCQHCGVIASIFTLHLSLHD